MRKLCLISVTAALVLASAACVEKGSGNTTPVIVNPDNGGNGETPPSPPAPPTPPVTGNIPTVGKVMPAWVKGNLDIHFINTTDGECTFIILPDGTQILVDAAGAEQATGAVGSQTNTGIRQRWDPRKDKSFDCGDFIIDYIDRCMAWTGNNKLDYVLVTHLHNDHYGAHLNRPVSSLSGTYRLQSMVKILEHYQTGKLLDRGYPDYNYPFDMMKVYTDKSESSVYNWISAVRWLVANRDLKVEKFVAGSDTQLSMVHEQGSFNCKVRNLAVNGDVWTGTGTLFNSTFPVLSSVTCANPPSVANEDNCPEENHESCCFKLSYGKFDYFAGADLQYDGCSSHTWKDIETPVAKACGKVEVMKADHHGCSNTNGTGYKGKKGTVSNALEYLNPQCWIVNSWTDGHPRQATYENVTELLPGMDTYITNTCTAMQSYKNYNRLKGHDGHIVVRVENGGETYRVCTLTDSDRQMTVKEVSGPYTSR